MAELTGKLSAIPSLNGSLSPVAGMVGTIERSTRIIYYDGAYIFVPSSEEQIVPTAGTTLNENIVIAPIPHNYGLITWNGSFLHIS